MAIVLGINPGAKGSFAVSALYLEERLPASLILSRLVAGVEEAVTAVVGVVGEWGQLSAVAVASPLTWSAAPHGWRDCDIALRKRLPAWAPAAWVRAPFTYPGAVTLQGLGIAWMLASEIKSAQLPQHAAIEVHPLLALALAFPKRKADLLALAGRGATDTRRERAVTRLYTDLIDSGLLRTEQKAPVTVPELFALVSALTALATVAPNLGMVTVELPAGEIRPVGRRPVVLLESLP